MKQVIGHRGAAGLGLENSRTAIKKGLALGAFALEVDVRQTRDNKLVLCHDADLGKMAGDSRKIADLDWTELRNIMLLDGSRLLSLEAALKLVGNQPMIIEMKDGSSEEPLLAVLDKFPEATVSVASFKRPLLVALRQSRPDLPLYVLEHTDSLDGVQFALRHNLQGIGLNFWLLSPFTYLRATRSGLGIYVYTVNNRFLGWFLRRLYPKITICSDHPARFK